MSAHPPKKRALIPVHFIQGRCTTESDETHFLAQTQHKVLLVLLLACSVWLGTQQTGNAVQASHPQAWVQWISEQWRQVPQYAGLSAVLDDRSATSDSAHFAGAAPKPAHPGVPQP